MLFQNGLVSPKGCYQCDACDHPPSQTPLHPLAVRAEPGLPNLPFTSGAGRKAGGREGSCFLGFAGTCLRQTLVISSSLHLCVQLHQHLVTRGCGLDKGSSRQGLPGAHHYLSLFQWECGTGKLKTPFQADIHIFSYRYLKSCCSV